MPFCLADRVQATARLTAVTGTTAAIATTVAQPLAAAAAAAAAAPARRPSRPFAPRGRKDKTGAWFWKCPDCGPRAECTEDHGSIVCTSCGLEICASTIDNGLNGEARSFAEDGDEFADSRIGGSFDPLFPMEEQMGTYIKAAGREGENSSLVLLCRGGNRQNHTMTGLNAVEARCRELNIGADATLLARKILHAVLEPVSAACVLCTASAKVAKKPPPRAPHDADSLKVSLCGHGICADCESSGSWFAEKKPCQLCSEPMKLRPARLNVHSTHAAVIYLAAKHTPGSGRMIEEVTVALPVTQREFSEGLRRVKYAAAGNPWLQEVLTPATSELPQLLLCLERRLAALQVEWRIRKTAVAALEKHGEFVRGHKPLMTVTAIVVLTLQQFCGADEPTAIASAARVCSGKPTTVKAVVDKLKLDKRFVLGEQPAVGQTAPKRAAAAPLPVAAAAAPLPSGWESYFDERRCTEYYHHQASDTTTWEHPTTQGKVQTAVAPLQPPAKKRKKAVTFGAANHVRTIPAVDPMGQQIQFAFGVSPADVYIPAAEELPVVTDFW